MPQPEITPEQRTRAIRIAGAVILAAAGVVVAEFLEPLFERVPGTLLPAPALWLAAGLLGFSRHKSTLILGCMLAAVTIGTLALFALWLAAISQAR